MQGMTESDLRALVIGIAGSVGAWYALQRVRVQYDWSLYISERLESEVEPPRYAVKVRRRQSGRWLPRTVRTVRRRLGSVPREVVDVRLHFELRFTGVSPTAPRTIRVVPIPPREWLPYVRVDRVLVVNPARIDAHERVRLPEYVRRVLEMPGVTIRDVLEIPGCNARLQAHLVGYDSFSGSRCVYSSHEWTIAHIKRGAFRATGLEIVPWSSTTSHDAYYFGDD